MTGFVIGLLAMSVYLYARLMMVKEKNSRSPFVPDEETEKKVEQLLREGEDVKAVKLTRKQYGFSLVEGKRYIDKKKAGHQHL
ncbi:hypothetical protein U0355_09915 [Salimicrobium sp. PL1-032A]|uniref:hypothetical protein n=1 Tax=Salimicrobium sp. PL1-032A TaxID=3095364 RepID=UPI0032600B28